MLLHAYLTPSQTEALTKASIQYKKSTTIRRLIREWDLQAPLPKPEKANQPMHLELDEPDYARLTEIAQANKVSLSAAIALLIEQLKD